MGICNYTDKYVSEYFATKGKYKPIDIEQTYYINGTPYVIDRIEGDYVYTKLAGGGHNIFKNTVEEFTTMIDKPKNDTIETCQHLEWYETQGLNEKWYNCKKCHIAKEKC